MPKKPKKKPEEDVSLPAVELGPEDRDLLTSAESASNALKDGMDDIGDVVDYSKMTMEQFIQEWRKFKKQQEDLQKQLPKMIAEEIEKQLKPLVDQLNDFTTSKKQIKLVNRFGLLDIPGKIYAKIKR